MGDTAATDSYRVLLSAAKERSWRKNPVSLQRSEVRNRGRGRSFYRRNEEKVWDARHNCSAFVMEAEEN